MSILEFQHVGKVYHNTTRALDDLVFVNEGEFVSIIGPSGAGKSTILRCINRLIDATGKSSMTAAYVPAQDSCETCAPKPE
ncbi:MAG: ATP-binding cassette domain-containing protein [Ruminococcus sp.]